MKHLPQIWHILWTTKPLRVHLVLKAWLAGLGPRPQLALQVKLRSLAKEDGTSTLCWRIVGVSERAVGGCWFTQRVQVPNI